MSGVDTAIALGKLIVEELTPYRIIITAIVLSFIISATSSLKKRGKIDWIEAVICGSLTLAISSALEYLRLPQELSIFLGGVVGFKGSLWVEKYFNSKTKID